jgi:hypothetical protein
MKSGRAEIQRFASIDQFRLDAAKVLVEMFQQEWREREMLKVQDDPPGISANPNRPLAELKPESTPPCVEGQC